TPIHITTRTRARKTSLTMSKELSATMASRTPTPMAALRSRPALPGAGACWERRRVPETGSGVDEGLADMARFRAQMLSDLEQLNFLELERLIDRIDVLLGQRLELLLGAGALVLTGIAVLD